MRDVSSASVGETRDWRKRHEDLGTCTLHVALCTLHFPTMHFPLTGTYPHDAPYWDRGGRRDAMTTTMTGDRDEGVEHQSLPTENADLAVMPRCARCNLSYLPAKSTSALKLTYCSFLCELGDLGFSMSGLESMERRKAEEPTEPILAELPAGG